MSRGETSENVMAAHDGKKKYKYAVLGSRRLTVIKMSRSLLVAVVVAQQRNKPGSDNRVLL